MTRDDIIKLARAAGCHDNGEEFRFVELRYLERFASLVAAAERERIKQANAPEIERINAYIKELEAAVIEEREACAALVDENAMACHSPIYRSLLQSNAQAIRERGKE